MTMQIMLWGALLLLAASFGGAVQPIGDSLAVFRSTLAGVVTVIALAMIWSRRAPWLAGIGMVCAAGAVWSTFAPARSLQTDAPAMTLYQKNMLFRPGDRDGVVQDILTLGPDVVTLQELHLNHLAVPAALQVAYSHQQICTYSAVGSVAVLSRLPAVDQMCLTGLGVAGLRVMGPERPVWVVSIHQTWPWPMPQAERAALIRPELARLSGPVVLAGDFNMVPWSHTLRAHAEAVQGQILGPYQTTFRIKWLWPLRIDQVIAPGGGETAARPLFGSDHHGLFARVYLR